MPTNAAPDMNQFRCDACGRHFNTEADLKSHRAECAAAKASGSGNAETSKGTAEEGDDREWVSTP
jgi:hypothetical protein